jgi:CBS domain containing-hemolysin-like protein
MKQKRRLLQTVEEAVNSHKNKLFIQRIDDDKLCDEDTTVEQSLSKFQEHPYPLLVIRKKEQTNLLGILTAFDLL